MSGKSNASSCCELQRSREPTLSEPGATDTHSRNTHARFPVIRQGSCMLTLIANSDAAEEDHLRTEGQLFHPRPAQGDRDEGIGGVARNRDASFFCS